MAVGSKAPRAVGEVPAPRFVDYLEPAVRGRVPVAIGKPWVAEESLEPLAARLAKAKRADAERLRARARALADGALLVLRAEMLPAGDLIERVFVDPLGRLQLVASTAAGKVRMDEDFSVAVVRRRPLTIEGPRAAALRQELRATLALPLATADRKPALARETIDWSKTDPDAIYMELAPPGGGGFVSGRFEALHAYSNGKLLLIGFTPFFYVEDANAATSGPNALSLLGAPPGTPPPPASVGPQPGPVYDHPKWGRAKLEDARGPGLR
jgi:hypothetical protein